MPGCCGESSISVVVFRVSPSKLYGAGSNPIPVSIALFILIYPVVHSTPEVFMKLKLGHVLSRQIVLPVVVVLFARSLTNHVYL